MAVVDPRIADLSRANGVDPLAVLAVAQVEAGGIPATINGIALMRLELHLLWRAWPSAYRSVLDTYAHVDGPNAWEGHRVLLAPNRVPTGAVVVSTDGHGGHTWVRMHAPTDWRIGQAVEQAALGTLTTVASGLPSPHGDAAREAVYASASWGRFQLLGRDHAALGYATPQAMAEAFTDEAEAVAAFFRRLANRPQELAALRELRWFDFARSYNGSGQPQWYADRMAAAYERLGAA